MNVAIKAWMFAVLGGILVLGTPAKAGAYNVWTDITANTTFPIGQVAQAGEAINLRNGDPATTLLAPVVQYRKIVTLSWGAIKDNTTNDSFRDSLQIGFDLDFLFSQFSNPLPTSAQWIRNLSIGPEYGVSAISKPGVGYPFFGVSYAFGD
jgi:hypothetical protein